MVFINIDGMWVNMRYITNVMSVCCSEGAKSRIWTLDGNNYLCKETVEELLDKIEGHI